MIGRTMTLAVAAVCALLAGADDGDAAWARYLAAGKNAVSTFEAASAAATKHRDDARRSAEAAYEKVVAEARKVLNDARKSSDVEYETLFAAASKVRDDAISAARFSAISDLIYCEGQLTLPKDKKATWMKVLILDRDNKAARKFMSDGGYEVDYQNLGRDPCVVDKATSPGAKEAGGASAPAQSPSDDQVAARIQPSEDHSINLADFVGKWEAPLPNNSTDRYTLSITQAGELKMFDGRKPLAVRVETRSIGHSIVVDWSDFYDGVVRYTLAGPGDILLIEQWCPKSQYPSGKPSVFRATRSRQ